MTVVDDMKEHVGGIRSVGEIADFIDHEDPRVRVRGEGIRELTRPKGGREIINERGGRGEEGIEAVLNRAVRGRDGQMRLPTSRFARENQ
jgi:hypothetical protein